MASPDRAIVPPRTLKTQYPVIDTDPHVSRVFGYARPSDYVYGAGLAALAPGTMLIWEKVAPSHVGRGGFPRIMRLAGALGFFAGVLAVNQRSCMRFYGFEENAREVEMDMREMVDKVKKGEPLYGVSSLTPYMQGVAARNSRYSAFWTDTIPWFQFVNHQQHGVDTAKYYQQAERELEAEKNKA